MVEYLVDLNATAAAVRAGYAEKNANQAGYRLMQEPEVAQAIAEAQASQMARVELTGDWVISRLRTTAEANVRGDSVRALELLGKHFGLFKDRIEHSGPGGGPVPMSLEICFVEPDEHVGDHEEEAS